MNQPGAASTERFSNRVANYVRYRPHYPQEVIDILRSETGLSSASIVADIGSGTGLSTELFLNNGCQVFAVEPNQEMREAAESQLRGFPNFHSVRGTAEATTLSDHSVDYVVAGQAFHWFDRDKAKAEFARIVRPNSWVVLLWNTRRTNSTPFLRAYETLLQQFGTDYREVQHTNIEQEKLQAFFAGGYYQRRLLDNEQRFDLEGLKGRLLSSSYTPAEGHPNYLPMLRALEIIFRQHEQQDQVCFEYDTEIYFGHVE